MEKDTLWWTAHSHKRPVQILKESMSQISLTDTFIYAFAVPLLLIKICVVNVGAGSIQPPALQRENRKTSKRGWEIDRWRGKLGKEKAAVTESWGEWGRDREGEVCGGHVGGHALLSPSFWPEFILPWRVSPICSSTEQNSAAPTAARRHPPPSSHYVFNQHFEYSAAF